MKQKKGSRNCVAVVACMATGCTIEEFNSFVGHNGEKGIIDLEFYKFLLHKGFVVGLGIESGWNEKLFIDEKTKIIHLEYNIYKYPAFLVVKSEAYPENGHAVYWDGNKVWDPNPIVLDGLPLSNYTIYRWFPIISANNVADKNCPSQFELK